MIDLDNQLELKWKIKSSTFSTLHFRCSTSVYKELPAGFKYLSRSVGQLEIREINSTWTIFHTIGYQEESKGKILMMKSKKISH